jgi:D-alanyl-lipoteichoic acid acyltransferase DltB (MBOAT superfamily)
MLFNSVEFILVFLPAALIIYRLADPYPRARMPVLIGLSLAFYSYWDPRFLTLMVFSIVSNWYAARLYAQTRRAAIITLAIIGNLLILGVFKYSAFFAHNVDAMIGYQLPYWHLALPLGISFFTFHHVMYLVDLKRGRAPIYPIDRYALYICFFPQAIAGPLARWNEVMDQFGQRAFAPGWERRCAIGGMFIVIGLVQKVALSDPLGAVIDPIYAQAVAGQPLNNGEAWIALGFAFQIFFDFAGYSDIAIGLGLIFNVALPRNFDAPFRSTSLIDLWQRWHMTLARFLRDYVLTPINNSGIGGRKFRIARLLFALVFTMALCGLWHGAGWTYVIWGTLQGVGLLFAVAWRHYLPPPPAWVGWSATFSYFVLTGVFFRAPSLDAAWHIFQGLAIWPSGAPSGARILLAAMFCAIVLPPSHEIVSRLTGKPRSGVAVATAMAAAFCVLEVGRGAPVNFIYFQF